jgi:hypothetical protein
MHKVLTRWLLNGLIATTVFGAVESHAAVVVTEQGLASDLVGGGDWERWPGAMSAANTGSRFASSLLVIDVCDDQDPQRDGDSEQLDDSIGNSRLGMATPNTLLSQVPGSGDGGSAIPNNLETPLQDSVQAALPPESGTHCPRGPTFRWFRPPRVWS